MFYLYTYACECVCDDVAVAGQLYYDFGENWKRNVLKK